MENLTLPQPVSGVIEDLLNGDLFYQIDSLREEVQQKAIDYTQPYLFDDGSKYSIIITAIKLTKKWFIVECPVRFGIEYLDLYKKFCNHVHLDESSLSKTKDNSYRVILIFKGIPGSHEEIIEAELIDSYLFQLELVGLDSNGATKKRFIETESSLTLSFPEVYIPVPLN